MMTKFMKELYGLRNPSPDHGLGLFISYGNLSILEVTHGKGDYAAPRKGNFSSYVTEQKASKKRKPEPCQINSPTPQLSENYQNLRLRRKKQILGTSISEPES